MSRQFWSEALAWATSNGTAIANTTTETTIFPSVSIPANYLQDGRVLRIKAFGVHGTTATPTLTFRVKFGSVELAESFAITTTSAVGGGASMTALWDLEAFIQTRSNGSTGTLFTDGVVRLYTSTAPTAGTVTNYGLAVPLASGTTGGTTPVAVTADLTADTNLQITAQWGTANAANSLQGNLYIIEGLN